MMLFENEGNIIMSCNQDGACNVYRRIHDDDDGMMCIYERIPGTSTWCRCTLDICLDECANSFLCGSDQEFCWVLNMHGGRCRTCQILIGQNIERVSAGGKAACSICMCKEDKNKQLCFIPSDPSSIFCIECMKSMVF